MEDRPDVNEAALKLLIVEIKLAVNRKLFEREAITEEMYNKAKGMILKGQ
jgi:hypothetical protein